MGGGKGGWKFMCVCFLIKDRKFVKIWFTCTVYSTVYIYTQLHVPVYINCTCTCTVYIACLETSI